MLGFDSAVELKKNVSLPRRDAAASPKNGPALVGYILTTKSYDPGKEAIWRLEDKASTTGFELMVSEWDVGQSANPYRVGLWRALRRLICSECEPRRLPYSLVSFQDYLSQALKPCLCGCGVGAEGLVVSKLDHICNDHKKGALLVLELAKHGKHVFAEDGICLSCCHPATRKLIGRAD
ncbi:MAG TPA: hypothetical protein V6D22_12645 [Candidatus Obscuribacterales bacterium]